MTTDRVLTIEQVYDLLHLAGDKRCITTLGSCPRTTLPDGSVVLLETEVLAWIRAGAGGPKPRVVSTAGGVSYQHRAGAGPRGGARG